MADEAAEPLPYVRETVLKKRKVRQEAADRKERVSLRKRQKKRAFQRIVKRPEDFVKEYRQKEVDHVRMKKRLKLRKLPVEEIGSRLIFVIRICGSTDMHPNTRKILGKLRLTQILSGVFLKASEANLKMLLSVEPFITYGYPNLKSVRELIYKKGRGMVDKVPTPLVNNEVIEQALGKFGIICLEDVVHEISNVGSHFWDVAKFLMPFKLKSPEKRRLQLKKKPFKDDGDSGNREDQINELISKLN